VRAIDIGGEDLDELAETLRLRADARIKYVIYKGQIFTSYDVSGRRRWMWGPYSGLNPHDNHMHVSVLDSADGDGRLWDMISDADINAIANRTAEKVWFHLITHPITGVKRGAQALLADALKFAHLAATREVAGGGATAEEVADELGRRLDS
jgi:hypothetical protein